MGPVCFSFPVDGFFILGEALGAGWYMFIYFVFIYLILLRRFIVALSSISI